ncbi:MAG TPA: DMT family transporter [Protaetiibacter sp.]|jgi:transporter family-2 protein|nr:DMT family transporter [Protaetiibacter sp.]
MSHDHALRPFVTSIAVTVAVVVGGFIALQARINGELALELHDGIVTALISFGTGTVVLGLALLVWSPGRRGIVRIRDAVRERRMSVWFLFGGVAGALMVVSQGVTAPIVGVALFTVALVGGQTVGSLILDRRGVGTMPAKPLTLTRMLGALLAVGAVAWAVSDRLQTGVPWWLLVLPFVAGAGTSWQQAVNGQLRGASGSVLSASFVSFLAGTVVLAIASWIDLASTGARLEFPAEPWLYAGGVVGIVFIASAAAIVPLTGVLLFGLATIVGQLGVAVLLDLLLPVADAGLDLATVGGAALAVLALAVAAFRRPGRRARVTDSTGASSR